MTGRRSVARKVTKILPQRNTENCQPDDSRNSKEYSLFIRGGWNGPMVPLGVNSFQLVREGISATFVLR